MLSSSSSASLRQQPRNGLFVRERPVAESRGVLLFVHGLGESGLCFEALLDEPRLDAWRRLAIDLPGYGKSPWQPEPCDFAATTARLAAWLDAEDLPPVVVVGHSMGGMLGADLARLVPARVRAFLNVEGNISFADCTASQEAAVDTLENFLARGHRALLERTDQGGAEDRALRGYYASLRLADPRQFHRDSVELVERSRAETLAAETAAVACPTHYVLGDPRGTGTHSRALLDAAGVSWQAIADAGHWPYLDQHEHFVDALIAFLHVVIADTESAGESAR